MKLKQYVKPASLQEAIALLRSTEGPVTLLAGGTDVLVYGREGDDRYADHTVVDIYGLPELRGIEETEDALLIGAGTTHTEIEQSPLVQRYADPQSRDHRRQHRQRIAGSRFVCGVGGAGCGA